MAANKRIGIKSLFSNNNFVLLFSLIAAIIFWMIITTTESPDSEKTVAGISIAVPTDNSVVSEMGLDVIDDISDLKAAVTVKGPAYVVSGLEQEDLAVTASISKVTSAGTYELELKAAKTGSAGSGDFVIASISPASITLSFDYIDTKQFPVTAQAIGASAVEGLVAEAPVVSDSNNATLTFKGSRTNIDKISRVVATATVNATLSKTETFDSALAVYDADGKPLDTSKYTITTADGISAPDVKISVPISRTKTVPIKAAFKNVPAAFATQGISHTLDNTSILVIGPPETVDAMSSVALSEIDFDQISANGQTFEAAVVLPEGVKSVDNVETVKVTIDGLDKYTVRTFTVSSIRVVGGSTASVSLTRTIKNVKICGPQSVLRNLKASELYAEIEMDGKQTGQHTVSVRIKCTSSNGVWQVGAYTATVDVK